MHAHDICIIYAIVNNNFSSFVERVIVNYPEIEIHFTIPNVATKKKASRVVL